MYLRRSARSRARKVCRAMPAMGLAVQQAMGDRVDILAFHDTVLGDSSVPLAFRRQRVERWMHVTR